MPFGTDYLRGEKDAISPLSKKKKEKVALFSRGGGKRGTRELLVTKREGVRAPAVARGKEKEKKGYMPQSLSSRGKEKGEGRRGERVQKKTNKERIGRGDWRHPHAKKKKQNQ